MSYWSVVGGADGHWPLQDAAADTVVAAEAGPNGVLLGGSTTLVRSTAGPTGWLPRALSFNGVADSIVTGQTGGEWSAGTLSLWVRPAAVQSSYSGVVSRRAKLTLYANLNSRYHYNWSDASPEYSFAGPTYGVGEWRHVALRIRPDGVDFFIDGSLIASNALAHATVAQSSPVCIGSDPYTAARFFQGDIAGVSVFDRALSESEVGELFAGPEPINTGLPALSGEVVAGGRLGLSVGSWEAYANGELAIQSVLQVSDDGATGWSDIEWSIAQSVLLLPESYEGKSIRLAVVATNAGGDSQTAYSAVSAVGASRWPATIEVGCVASGRTVAGSVSAPGGLQAGRVIPSER